MTVIHGDCRDVLPTLVLSEYVVITDPPWLSGGKVDIEGAGSGAAVLWGEVAPLLSSARAVVVFQSPLDPPFSAVPGLPFLQTCWLRIIPPSYNGTRLRSASIAFVYGSPPRPEGKKCWSCEAVSASEQSRAARRASPHPCPMSLDHARWLVRWFASGAPVLDPFAGAGTILRAAAEIGCPGILGIESDERWVPVARAALDGAQPPLPGMAATPEPDAKMEAFP